MKAIGMFFIIAAHLPALGSSIIYVFSVPLFFIISGFLGKREESNAVFWKKIFSNLILPCILICLVNHTISLILGRSQLQLLQTYALNCFLGFQGEETIGGGLGMCWFLYTLIVCKIIGQYIAKNKYLHVLFLICCIVFALWYNTNDFHWYNAIANASLAYPMYACGGGYKYFYKNDKIPKLTGIRATMLILICSLVVLTVGIYNGPNFMYNNEYGRNILLFFIGGLAGTILVYVISSWLQNIQNKAVDIISRGTIIILGFHGWFVLLNYLVNIDPLIKYIEAFSILVFFIPVILAAEKYCPVIMGKRANNHKKEK